MAKLTQRKSARCKLHQITLLTWVWRLSNRWTPSQKVLSTVGVSPFATRARVVPGVVWWKEKSGGEVWSPKKSDVFRAHLSAKLVNKVWQLELLLSQATNPEYFLERKTNHKVASVLGRQKYYSRKNKGEQNPRWAKFGKAVLHAPCLPFTETSVGGWKAHRFCFKYIKYYTYIHKSYPTPL